MSSTSYVAFLRGINVGGNAPIKMAVLKSAFESLGFEHVTPVLASGNVVFKTAKGQHAVLKQRIEQVITKQFKVQAVAIIRSAAQIVELLNSNPFKSAKPNQTKVNITFLAEEINRGAKFPVSLSTNDFQIFQVLTGEICSAVDLSSGAGTSELMKVLEKQFGKAITTRTWATVERIAELMKPE